MTKTSCEPEGNTVPNLPVPEKKNMEVAEGSAIGVSRRSYGAQNPAMKQKVTALMGKVKINGEIFYWPMHCFWSIVFSRLYR